MSVSVCGRAGRLAGFGGRAAMWNVCTVDVGFGWAWHVSEDESRAVGDGWSRGVEGALGRVCVCVWL